MKLTNTERSIESWLPTLGVFDAYGMVGSNLIVALETRPDRDIDLFESNGQRYRFTGYVATFLGLCQRLIAEAKKVGVRLRKVNYQGVPLKPLALAAGIGTRGKNTLVVHSIFGCRLRFALLIMGDTTPRPSFGEELSNCGDCRRCLDVCPIHAIEPYRMLDQTRCTAYLELDRPTVNARRCARCAEVCP